MAESTPEPPPTSTPTGAPAPEAGRPAYIFQRRLHNISPDLSRSSRQIEEEFIDSSPRWVSRLATVVLLRAYDDARLTKPSGRAYQTDIDEARRWLRGEEDRDILEFWCRAAHISPLAVIKWARAGGFLHAAVPLIPRPLLQIGSLEGDDDDDLDPTTSSTPNYPSAPGPGDLIDPDAGENPLGDGLYEALTLIYQSGGGGGDFDPSGASRSEGAVGEGVSAADGGVPSLESEQQDRPVARGVGSAGGGEVGGTS